MRNVIPTTGVGVGLILLAALGVGLVEAFVTKTEPPETTLEPVKASPCNLSDDPAQGREGEWVWVTVCPEGYRPVVVGFVEVVP